MLIFGYYWSIYGLFPITVLYFMPKINSSTQKTLICPIAHQNWPKTAEKELDKKQESGPVCVVMNFFYGLS